MPPPRKKNAVLRIIEQEERVRKRAAEAAEAAASSTTTASRPQCLNPACSRSDVREDGTCHNCGVIADDSNIVAEVQFSEGSNGAAIVQGSYMGADQGGVRAAPGAFARRPGGGQSREKVYREMKQFIDVLAQRLKISEATAKIGFYNYKMAADAFNFSQGRSRNPVAAVCLYAACRRENSCKIMLIDLADLLQQDVFQLGRYYKHFLELFPQIRSNTKLVDMEDLIFRFAARLEFARDTNKIAVSAIRIARRMQYDEMTHGRKPAGICGASVIMAARAHNYRRTVREVVYIAKVTMHTLQARMEEFSNVPSAQMSIEDFANQDFLHAHHDPPLVYKRTKEWQEKHPGKQRSKRTFGAISTDGQDGFLDGTAPPTQDKRQRIAGSNPSEDAPGPDSASAEGNDARSAISPSTSIDPQLQDGPSTQIVDKDNFAVPALPSRLQTGAANATQQEEFGLDEYERSSVQIAQALEDEGQGDGELPVLAGLFDDGPIDPSSEAAMAIAQGIEIPSRGGGHLERQARKGKGKEKTAKEASTIPIDSNWEADEVALEQLMESHLKNPEMINKAKDALRTEKEQKKLLSKKRAEKQAQAAEETAARNLVNLTPGATPGSVDDGPEGQPADAEEGQDRPETAEQEAAGDAVGTAGEAVDEAPAGDTIIGEDEFKDDPEVMHCKLSEEEIKIKETIWVNHNKEYLRSMQQKLFSQKMQEKNPKKTRSRKKQSAEGDASGSSFSSPAESAAHAFSKRMISMRINYNYDDLFASKRKGPGGVGSVGSRSAITSRAPSVDIPESGGLSSGAGRADVEDDDDGEEGELDPFAL
jgi:transcription factor IIIB subunit 2